ncbi:MAG: hypothetical protein F6K31_04620 [Symploca sp. SIO2G7]|nr:hypothetical protein [Symploca sp. SIO2G7]
MVIGHWSLVISHWSLVKVKMSLSREFGNLEELRKRNTNFTTLWPSHI